MLNTKNTKKVFRSYWPLPVMIRGKDKQVHREKVFRSLNASFSIILEVCKRVSIPGGVQTCYLETLYLDLNRGFHRFHHHGYGRKNR